MHEKIEIFSNFRTTLWSEKVTISVIVYFFKVAYTREMVEYRWKYDPVNILNMELAEFDLTKTEYSIKNVEYVAGIYRCECIKSILGGPVTYTRLVYYTPYLQVGVSRQFLRGIPWS